LLRPASCLSAPLSTVLVSHLTATTAIYTLSLHDALPIFLRRQDQRGDQTGGAGAHGGHIGEVDGGRPAPDIGAGAPVAPEVPVLDLHVRGDHEPAVGGGNHGGVIARAQACGIAAGQVGPEAGQELGLVDIADALVVSFRPVPAQLIRRTKHSASMVTVVLCVHVLCLCSLWLRRYWSPFRHVGHPLRSNPFPLRVRRYVPRCCARCRRSSPGRRADRRTVRPPPHGGIRRSRCAAGYSPPDPPPTGASRSRARTVPAWTGWWRNWVAPRRIRGSSPPTAGSPPSRSP